MAFVFRSERNVDQIPEGAKRPALGPGSYAVVGMSPKKVP